MTPQPLPLVLDVVLHTQVDGDVGPHPRGLLFTDVGFGYLHDADGEEGEGHAGPASEDDLPVFGGPRLEAGDRVLDVAPDLVGGLELKEFEVAEKIAGMEKIEL